MQYLFMKHFSLFLCFMITLVGCSKETEPLAVSTYFPLGIGEKTIFVQVVLTQSERQRGLMHRDSLPEDSGMLFIFETPRELGFWMKNTKIPLDIAYIEPSGRIAEIYPMYPYNTNSVKSVSQNLSMALEMDQGWFAKNDITLGAVLKMEDIVDMINARGFDLKAFAVEQ